MCDCVCLIDMHEVCVHMWYGVCGVMLRVCACDCVCMVMLCVVMRGCAFYGVCDYMCMIVWWVVFMCVYVYDCVFNTYACGMICVHVVWHMWYGAVCACKWLHCLLCVSLCVCCGVCGYVCGCAYV